MRCSSFAVALEALLLAGCNSTPKAIPMPQVVRVPVTQYVPLPADLLKRCPIAELADRTVESVVEAANARKLALEQCNRQLDEIEGLQP